MMRFKTRDLILSLALAVIALGCASSKLATKSAPSPQAQASSAQQAITPPVQIVRGMASWYGGKRFNGRKTASGERMNRKALTCAHPTLPFGTRIRVLDLSSGKSVIVRVNDRGPFTKNRLIDLSEAAARSIGLIRKGTAEVELTVLDEG